MQIIEWIYKQNKEVQTTQQFEMYKITSKSLGKEKIYIK